MSNNAQNRSEPAGNSNNAGTGPDAVQHVDQIRNILFGGQMRDYDQRFAGLEQHLAQQGEELRQEILERAAALTDQGSKGFDALSAQLKAEKAERVELGRELAREIKELSKTVDRGLAQLQDHAERLHKELLKHVAEQTKALREEARAASDELAALVEREVAALQGEKADRQMLGDVLAEMAARLKGGERDAKGK
jgi:gas vesicle protein